MPRDGERARGTRGRHALSQRSHPAPRADARRFRGASHMPLLDFGAQVGLMQHLAEGVAPHV